MASPDSQADITPQFESMGSNSLDEIFARFPSVLSWAKSKRRNVCYCLAILFNYLATPREGVISVAKIPSGNKRAIDGVGPVISFDMIKYLLEDIFPCGAMIQDKNVLKPSKKWVSDTEDIIRKYISNKNFLQAFHIMVPGSMQPIRYDFETIPIDPLVTQLLWVYIYNNVHGLLHGSESDDDVKEKIAAMEEAVLSRRAATHDYGLEDDIENCSLQAILFVVIALLDWYEQDSIGVLEIKTAYRIIIPLELQVQSEPVLDVQIADSIRAGVAAINMSSFSISGDAIALLTSIILQVRSNKLKIYRNKSDAIAKRFINRFMGLCGPI